MRCEDARAGLWPPERPRLAGEAVVEARAHVDGCEACRAWFGQDRRLLEVYRRMGEAEAPAEVRERVFDALARARASRGRGKEEEAGEDRPSGLARAVAGWLLAAVGVVAVVTLPGSPPSTASAPAGEIFVEDYLRRAVGEDHIETTDPSEVRRFLARELGIRISPIQAAGLVLEGAEICLLEGRRGAMIVYKKDGARVSHYLVPREGARPRRPSLSERTRGGEGGMPVVTWSTRAVEEALVGELPSEELLELAVAGAS